MTVAEETNEKIYNKIAREMQIRSMQQGTQQQQMLPENPIETAHILISNSELTELLPEIEKEVKLSNLDEREKTSVYLFINAYYSLKLLENEQFKKYLEYYNMYKHKLSQEEKDHITDTIENYINFTLAEKAGNLDKANALRKGVFIPTLSRGKGGFERTKQVETISNYKVESIDKTEQNPGFLNIRRMMGGGFNK